MSKDKNDIHKLATGTIVNQRYEIIELLGAGGFGNTYLARDTRFSSSTQYVCIKEFFLSGIATRATNGHDIKLSDPTKADSYEEQRLRFRREAERIFSLRDEHIVRVSDLFDENGTSYYVMDYIAGQSLAQYIKEKEKLSEIEALRIVLQILYGLRVIHEINLIHLDIKPGNIMIDQHGRIMLIDFGASKIIENGSATLSAAILTTPGYAPLEQTLAELDRIGEWTDLYAVGGTFYKMLTGVTPSNAQVIIDEGRDAFSFPLEISTKSRELIFWLMNTRISERPHSTAEVITRVEHILEEFEKDSSLDKGKPVLVTPEKKTISQLSDVAKAQQKSPNIPEQQSGNVAPTPPPALNSGAPQPLFTPAPPVGAQSANKANNNIGSQVPNSNYGKPIPSAV
ncbi:MAG: serine/threonine protein kinase, partial [Bacteroidaceae bacterium]|nr:serine/threonine protein kinase [Bacteroidaceae bacterium]